MKMLNNYKKTVMGATLVVAMIAVPVSAVAAPAGADNETEVSTASVEIPGRVIDAATGKPLAGARVSVVNSTATVSTGDDGAFALKSPSSRVTLKVEFPGYNTVIVPASGRSEVAVRLSQSTGSTVYDTDVLAAGATTLVSDFPIGEVAADRSVSDLQGDLLAISRSGMPGAGHTVYVSGLHSINTSSQPLYVVDGVIWTTSEDAISTVDGHCNNPLALISP
ncbi:MAG: carboxypeptidase-like regulatory domain-containing protein, partial [Duncaniella sp.]|nr:carboxypeptidase-like regulatory domain-containing protein [Duncaniella sp.]